MVTKASLLIKYLLEEISGATSGDPGTTEMRVKGSAEPKLCGVPGSVTGAVTHNDKGHLGDEAMDVAAHMLSQKQGGEDRPTMWAYGDNQGVVDNINTMGYRSKGLRRVARVVAHLRSLVDHKIVLFQKVTSEEQRADGLTKQYTSPVQNADAMERVLGKHPEVTKFRQEVHDKFDKRGKGWRKVETACCLKGRTTKEIRWWAVHSGLPSRVETRAGPLLPSVSFARRPRETSATVGWSAV
jgi:hypothetical protein